MRPQRNLDGGNLDEVLWKAEVHHFLKRIGIIITYLFLLLHHLSYLLSKLPIGFRDVFRWKYSNEPLLKVKIFYNKTIISYWNYIKETNNQEMNLTAEFAHVGNEFNMHWSLRKRTDSFQWNVWKCFNIIETWICLDKSIGVLNSCRFAVSNGVSHSVAHFVIKKMLKPLNNISKLRINPLHIIGEWGVATKKVDKQRR